MIDCSNISFVFDSSGTINLDVLEKIVWSMYNENGERQTTAVKILEGVRTHPSAWRSVDKVLTSQSSETKYFGIQLLEAVIHEKWRTLNIDEQASLKTYITRMCGFEGIDKVILLLLRRDWSVMDQIISGSVQNEQICRNCMKVLSQLTPDIVNLESSFHIFELCRFVLERSNSGDLIYKTLSALKNLLTFLTPPPGLLLRISTCMGFPQLKNISLDALSEGLSKNPKFEEIYNFSRETLLNIRVDITQNRVSLQSITIFVTTLFSYYYSQIKEVDPNLIQIGINYLLQISEDSDRTLFIQCVEYWNQYVAEIYAHQTEIDPQVLQQLRLLMISRMAKPEEVVVVQLEDGTTIREVIKDTEEANLYKAMKEILIYLTHLDMATTVDTMMNQLVSQVDKKSVCWAIGAISGTLVQDDEKNFIVGVLKNLLATCEYAQSKDEKAVVASNIMYIVAQYPRFLQAHDRFLRTVVHKLFEFMHEMHEGVQDMACDTFYKLVERCRDNFVEMQSGHPMRFIFEIIGNLKMIISDLSQQQLLVVYEGLASPIKSHLKGSAIIDSLMELPNHSWNSCKYQLSDIPQLIQILRINTTVCRKAGTHFQRQMSIMYPELIQFYTNLHSSNDKLSQTFKDEILILISAFLDVFDNTSYVIDNMVPALLSLRFPVIEPSVIMVMTSLINCLEELANPYIYTIFGMVFTPTLNLITKDFVNFPEVRIEFANFIYIFLQKCSSSFVQFNENHMQTVIRTILWFIQHPTHDVSHKGFESLRILFGSKMHKLDHQKFMAFVRIYYLPTMDQIFTLFADPVYTAGGIKPYAVFFADMMKLAEDLNERINPESDNVPYVFNYAVESLQRRYFNPNLMKIFVEGLFSFDKDVKKMKKHIRDFVVQIRGQGIDNLTDNYLEEKADEMSKARKMKAFVKPKIPGLLDNDDAFYDDL